MPRRTEHANESRREASRQRAWTRATAGARGLLVLDDLISRPPLADLMAVASAIAAGGAGAAPAYAGLWRAIAATGLGLTGAVAAAIATSENLLATAAPKATGNGPVPPTLLAAAAHDLKAIARLVAIAERLAPAVRAATGNRVPPLPGKPGTPSTTTSDGSLEWDDLAAPDGATRLATHYARHGGGYFARARAFTWTGIAPTNPFANLSPVASPDPIRAADLVGSFEARVLLRRNTANLLRGAPANNVLLYGDRGTGKSSSVKSLLYEPDPEAWGDAVDPVADASIPWHLLRLVEVPKSRLVDFPVIAAALRDRPERFVVFVDDLSFEDGETEYKDLKALLDGGLAARPSNVVVYATSNRRHLIREQFSDRPDPLNRDVHGQDTVQEKLSFADRFGLTLTFTTPSQEEYVAIASHLAKRRGLPVASIELRRRAIAWAAWHNGRSGRTARQFIDDLTAEMG